MKKNGTIKVKIYLFRKCGRAKQEGTMIMLDPKGKVEGHFNHLDEIPAKIRKRLEEVGLAYDIADNSDDTVIVPKTRKRRVIKKVRRGD